MSSIIKPVLGSQLNLGRHLSKGLVGLWLLNEGSGNKVFDLSGNRNDGTFTGMVDWVSGKFGSATKILVGGNITLSLSAYDMGIRRHATFVSFFRIHNITSARSLFSDWNSSLGMNMFTNNDGTCVCYVYPNNHRVTKTFAFVNNIDYMMVAVMDGANLYLSVNAGPQESVVLGEDIGNSVSPLNIGERGDASGSANHTVHAAYIFNRALSASEIALLYREPFGMFERDPIELWVGATSVGVPTGAAGIMTTNTGYWGATF